MKSNRKPAFQIESFSSLHIRHLQSIADGKPLHDPVTCEVGPNSRLLLVGPSGIGKTTLLRAVLGFSENWQGTISINSTPLDEVHLRTWRKTAAYLPQKVDIGDGCVTDLLDDLIPPPQRPALEQWIKRLKLPARLESRTASQLSGGELQRLGLALIMAREPALLVLDEPTASLDDDSATVLLQALQEFPGAILASSHDQRLKQMHAIKELALQPIQTGSAP